MRLFLAPVLIAAACILAGLYGALHNQISYTVSPGYFHEFKFIQFGIDPALQTRLGAALVGGFASWWMGVVIGVPIFLLCLAVKETGSFIRTFFQAALTVVGVTLLVGLGALLVGYITIQGDSLPIWMTNREVSDPVAFARAGQMHNFSYLGGLIGLFVGAAVVIRKAVVSRRANLAN